MYTSKNTSVNSKRSAAIYDFIGYDMRGCAVLDYGCGKYFLISKEYAKQYKPASMTFYDPYWKNQSPAFRTYDIIICANVLNVLKSERDLLQCIDNCLNVLEIGGSIYFQVYEGDRTGVGRETKKDCWQRNERTRKYLRYFEKVEEQGFSVKIYKNYIIVKDEIPF